MMMAHVAVTTTTAGSLSRARRIGKAPRGGVVGGSCRSAVQCSSVDRRGFLVSGVVAAGSALASSLPPSSSSLSALNLVGVPPAVAAETIVKNTRFSNTRVQGIFNVFVRRTIRESLGKDLDSYAQLLVRTALHDAGTYDPATKTGGMNGSIRFELDRPENKELAQVVKRLEAIKKEIDAGWKVKIKEFEEGCDNTEQCAANDQMYPFEGISWGDLIASAGMVGIQQQYIQDIGEALYVDDANSRAAFPFYFGRGTADSADRDGAIPKEPLSEGNVAEYKAWFQSMGIGKSAVQASKFAALFSLAYLGGNREENEKILAQDSNAGADCGPFDNTCAPPLAGEVEKYQRARKTRDENSYQVDLNEAYVALCSLGGVNAKNFDPYAYVYIEEQKGLPKIQ